MEQLWDPWIGPNYGEKINRIFLIGESHYCIDKQGNFDQDCYNEFISKRDTTIKIVETARSKKGRWNLFKNTYKLFYGNNNNYHEAFWNSVSFYNLIQRPMRTTKDRPTSDDFSKSSALLFSVLFDFKIAPTHIIFLGNSAQWSFIEAAKNHPDIKIINDHSKKVGRYKARNTTAYFGENKINISFIKHPSSYFSWKRWRGFLESRIDNFSSILN